MPNSTFASVTQRLHRQTIATFGSLVLALMLACMLALGTQHAVEQTRARLSGDFSQRVEYLLEQEQFLQQLHAQDARQQRLPEQLPTDVHQPFDFLPAAHAATISPAYAAIGTYLSRQYSAFWAFSYFPAAPLLVVNGGDGSALLVPGQLSGHAARDVPDWQRQAGALVAQQGPLLPPATRAGDGLAITPVRWVAMPGEPGKMLGIAHAGFRSGRVATVTDDAAGAYMATVFSEARLFPANVAEASTEPAFWLYHAGEGVLLGRGQPPSMDSAGFHPGLHGLGLRLHDRSGEWVGYYQVGYASLFADNLWLLAVALALFVLAVLASIGYLRWYRLHVIAPARLAQERIIESEAFNRTLIETAPVALCLLVRENAQVVFATALAQQWLDLQPTQTMPVLSADAVAWRHMLQSNSAGLIETIELENGRSLHMAYAPTRYRGQDVVLCAFTDVTVHAEEQRALARARAAADAANAAKSTFLATMSHEIRTPLYGLLGTLELLAMTTLDERQSQHVDRLQDASQQLLQQISDILDISKIEAGQMQVESSPFDPAEIVQHCTNAFSAMARQKGLLLFCTIDRQVPGMVHGDAARVRQVVSNLISNALKFTPAGHVIVRLQVLVGADGGRLLRFQVADTGIGIPDDKRDQLFIPFNDINQSEHTVRGTGLGLSICERLARLMGGRLTVVSEAGLGSSFSLELTLAEAVMQDAVEHPRLSGLRLVLRTPHPELSRHLHDWLVGWGAEVEMLGNGEALPAGEGRVLLDVQMPAATTEWAGRHLRVAPLGSDPLPADIIADGVHAIAMQLQRTLQQLPPSHPHQASAGFQALGLDVLVAEDNPINQATLYDQLQQLGCRVTVAGDGEQALAQWNAHGYDVVLTDINMPRMNGYVLARTLRDQGVRCPIVGVTANAMRDEEQRCLDSGMDAWLVKPIDLQHLHGLLRQWQTNTPEVPVRPYSPPGQAMAQVVIPEKYRQVFRSTMRVDIDRCRDAVRDADAALVKQKLHRMRGALVTVGNVVMAGTLENAEQRLSREPLESGFGDELLALCQALDKLVAST